MTPKSQVMTGTLGMFFLLEFKHFLKLIIYFYENLCSLHTMSVTHFAPLIQMPNF